MTGECTYCARPAVGEHVRTYRTKMGFSRDARSSRWDNRTVGEPNALARPTVVTWRSPACAEHLDG